jgi:long-chain acyl-CoA synthetase
MESHPWYQYYDYNVPTTIRYPRIPVQNLMHFAASQFPTKTAVDVMGEKMTFAELRSQILRLANALVRMGVKKGDRIGIALPNCPEYIISYHAALSVGAMVVNLNPLYTHGELKFMMENTGIETLITSDDVFPMMQVLAGELRIPRLMICGSNFKGYPEEGIYSLAEVVENCRDTKIPAVMISHADPALIQFTGGTTGHPKGAVLTHASLVAAAYQISLWFNPLVAYIRHELRSTLLVIPLFHIYGNLCMHWSMVNAATQVLLPRFELDEIIETIARYDQISFFPSVPTMITAVINHPRAEEIAEGLRYFHSGAAPMPTELIARVRNLGINFGEGWAMSETAGAGVCNPLLANKVGSIGIPLMDNDIRLVDIDQGIDEVKRGEPGEILIKGPTVMQGYWNNPEETTKQLRDGWLCTGDIAQQDADGYLYIVDRKKDMIIAGGFNIYPREVDEVLYQHPQVREAITVGIPDPYRGETVKAFVSLVPGAMVTDKEIIAFCKQKLAPYKVPKQVEFRESLPKSAVGKLLRKILRDEEMAKK